MASATLAPYKNNTTAVTFALVSTSPEKTTWRVASRALSEPFELSLQRKIGPSGARANDHVILKVSKTDRNVTTGIPATSSVTLDISLPRDNSILTGTVVGELIALVASVCNDNTALAATTVARTALVGGNDF